MARSLIDGIYDNYLKHTSKGQEYEVPIVVAENSTNRKILVHVWAKNTAEAEERGIAHAHTLTYKHNQKLNTERRSMGVLLPLEHYKPKGIVSAIASPFAVWRDPVYKKAMANISGSVGYRAGTMARLSIEGLMGQTGNINNDDTVTEEFLTQALKVNIISIFIWTGLLIVGILFLLLGLNFENEEKFVISWLNPYIIASIVSILIGVLAIYKTVRDYNWIIMELDNIEQQAEYVEDSKDG